MNTQYTCFLDNNRNIIYKKSYDNKYVPYYKKIISIPNWVPIWFHKPIIYLNMIPKPNFAYFTQDPWPLKFSIVKNIRTTPRKNGRYLFNTYFNNDNQTIDITEITENKYIHLNYFRIFNSIFHLDNPIIKLKAYFLCFPKPKFIVENIF